MRRAVVQVPAFVEPNIDVALAGIATQTPPPGWMVDVEAWVTMDQHDNETWRLANADPGVSAHEAPPGKLSARNAAHDWAVSLGADAVVTWDADCYPANANVLTELLAPLDDGAAAVNGKPVPAGVTPFGMVNRVMSAVEDAIWPHMHGQLSAIPAETWRAAGPFDDSLDQTDGIAVRNEEEFDFYSRCAALGPVPTAGRAVVYETPRRSLYRFNKATRRLSMGRYQLDQWERERGQTTFDTERP